MNTQQSLLAEIITAIGTPEFPKVVAASICNFTEFQLSAVLVHKTEQSPILLFDNFTTAGYRKGIENYTSYTHAINPMIDAASSAAKAGAFRARDFHAADIRTTDETAEYLCWSSDEELGFRTKGWPENLEEIILYYPACGGLVELGIYRERSRKPLSPLKLRELETLGHPIAAAFDRTASLTCSMMQPRRFTDKRLTPREKQIVELLLIGCSSEAIELRLGLSRHTVKEYRKQAYRKLGVSSLAELFAASARVAPSGGG